MQPANILDVLGSTPTPERTDPLEGALGREDFLRMLIAQLENQDPLNPQDPTQFSAQLAQFSTLEQLIAIRTAMESMASPDSVDQTVAAANLIGREVVAGSDHFSVGPDGATSALEFDLDETSATTLLEITNVDGARVRTLDLGRLGPGRHRVTLEELGAPLPAGSYGFRVQAGSGEQPLTPRTFVRGRVTGAAAAGEGSSIPRVQLGDLELPLDALVEIRSVGGAL